MIIFKVGKLYSVLVFLILTTQLVQSCEAGSEKDRVALVIGNSNYSDGKVTGVENAKAMAEVLRQLNFKVLTPVLDGNLERTNLSLGELKAEIKDASVVLFFYSGHGFQIGGVNYLQPIGGSFSPDSSVSVADVLRKLGAAPNSALKLVFLDACRTRKQHPNYMAPGLAGPGAEPGPPGVVKAFAASPNQEAGAGDQGSLSPYTMALLNHIRTPGLDLGGLLTLIKEEVRRTSITGQLPTEEGLTSALNRGFYFRPPVFIRAVVEEADDDLVGILNGQVVLSGKAKGKNETLRLQAGHNPLIMLVSNQASRRSGHSWERTEGWSYRLRLFGPGGTELTAPGCKWKKPCFEAEEPVPFKDGPHHGGVFEVATADLYVDPVSGQLELRDVDTIVWSSGSPLWAREQKVLYQIPIKTFPLAEMAGFPPGTDISNVAKQAELVLEGLGAKGVKLPDFNHIFAVVRGNGAFQDAATACLEDKRNDRMADLKKSFTDALAGQPKPFDSFDQALSACVRSEMLARPEAGGLRPEDIKVWTAFEDRNN